MAMLADLHIHSRFSRATSRDLDFVTLHRAALEKGIELVGTGDVTHPGWRGEIREQLVEAEPGLYRLRPDLARAAEEGLPRACAGREVRFVLEVEISNIYKKGERVRKNHNLVYLPSLDAVERLVERLKPIGNLASDGRPILGLDARHLLEITLEVDPLAFLVPAHIWTPWFSMLGSKSGFDSLEECFDDLAGHIFAVETGLSSDPPMNWRLSDLDRLTLVSNSDAHSARTLGREANLLDIEPGFEQLRRALETRDGFLGTVEFFPEEGKYHLDGHRKCRLRLHPAETRRLGGRCPRCGGKLTVGVMSRVLDLADQPDGRRPDGATDFERLVPLPETVAQGCGAGPASKRVQAQVTRLLEELGPELDVLRQVPVEDIRRVAGPAVAEAVRRVRAGEVTIAAGYDGEFGTVQVFGPGELEAVDGQLSFFTSEPPGEATPAPRVPEPGIEVPEPPVVDRPAATPDPGDSAHPLADLDAAQRRAAETFRGPLLIVAGPGTGKTRTLVARIAYQIRTGAARPEQVLAIAFTNQAADELAERVRREVPGATPEVPLVTTFHGLGLRLLGELTGDRPHVLDEDGRLELLRRAIGDDAGQRELAALGDRISLAKQSRDPAATLADDPPTAAVSDRYRRLLEQQNVVDVDDLLLEPYRRLVADPAAAAGLASRWTSLCVDEYQDVNDVQAALLRLLAPDGGSLCAIGDPMQAIYGFRGARPGHFARFRNTFPGTTVVELDTSYRLTAEVLSAAWSVVRNPVALRAIRRGPQVELVDCPSPDSEGEQIVIRLERIVGGTSYFAVDSGRGRDAEVGNVGFGDVAVLCRTRTQRRQILAALDRSAIPCHRVGEDEPHDPRSEKVAVMTMHAAKGREFDVVFVTGVERGLVPLERDGMTTDPDEERRLLYVAMTRARRLLVLSWAARRTLWGQRLPGSLSPLLADLPSDVIRSSPSLPERPAPSPQMKLF